MPSTLPTLDRRKPGVALHPLLREKAIGIASVPPSAEVLRRVVAGLRKLDGDPAQYRATPARTLLASDSRSLAPAEVAWGSPTQALGSDATV